MENIKTAEQLFTENEEALFEDMKVSEETAAARDDFNSTLAEYISGVQYDALKAGFMYGYTFALHNIFSKGKR